MPQLELGKGSCIDPKDAEVDGPALLEKHLNKKEYTPESLKKVLLETSLLTWSANKAAEPLQYVRGDGVYFHTLDGKRYFDLNSQAMCMNLGHTAPPEVVDAVTEQFKTAAYCYPCQLATPMKAKLSSLLADICPGDLDTFFYNTGGGEANEAAIHMVRAYTGKQKILSSYRSYHGGQSGSGMLTGDARRFFSEPGTGYVKFMSPQPWTFKWGEDEEAACRDHLKYMHELIISEGPDNIAAIWLEPVIGSNGVLKPPTGWLEGIRALCDQYEILMVSDEVMAGFGRTGKWFGFQHTTPMVVPDVITFAKGINGGFLPLGGVGVRNHLRDFFDVNPVGTGTTYAGHATTLASAFGALQYMLKNDVVGNSNRMGKVMTGIFEDLAEKHPSVGQARNVGLFGIIDLQKNSKGEPFSKLGELMSAPVADLRNKMLELGVWTMFRPMGSIFCNPPLVVTEEQLHEVFDVVDQALAVTDAVFEG